MADYDYKAEAVKRARKISYEYKPGTDSYEVTPLKIRGLIPAIITTVFLIILLMIGAWYIFPLYFPG